MLKPKKVGIYDLAKPFAVAMSVLGLVAGVLYGVGGAIYDLFNGQLGFGTILAFFAIIGMPLIFATCGFVVGVIAAVLNNLVASWINR